MSNDVRFWIGMAGVFGLTGVAAGALGAHALRGSLSESDLAIFETAARYHVYHALALLGVAYLSDRLNRRMIAIAGWLFSIGVGLFSGSLYLMALTDVRILGAVTPFGGAAFLAGWALIVAAALRGQVLSKPTR